MGVIGWIVFGLVVGIVAKFFMPGKDPGGSSSRVFSVSQAPSWVVSLAVLSVGTALVIRWGSSWPS